MLGAAERYGRDAPVANLSNAHRFCAENGDSVEAGSRLIVAEAVGGQKRLNMDLAVWRLLIHSVDPIAEDRL